MLEEHQYTFRGNSNIFEVNVKLIYFGYFSGAAALAYAVVLGQREKSHDDEEFKPHNMANVFLGTGFIWFGWFGFNGGSGILILHTIDSLIHKVD